MMLELTVTPDNKPGTFTTSLDGQVLVANRPGTIRPAARRMLDMGHDPEALLTCRVAGASYPSFSPRPIWRWAMEALTEGDRFTLTRWAPHPQAEVPSWYAELAARLDAEKAAEQERAGAT